jgi:hypothetical protein
MNADRIMIEAIHQSRISIVTAFKIVCTLAGQNRPITSLGQESTRNVIGAASEAFDQPGLKIEGLPWAVPRAKSTRNVFRSGNQTEMSL